MAPQDEIKWLEDALESQAINRNELLRHIAELKQAGQATLLREIEKDKRIAELQAENERLGEQLTDSDCQLVDALAENERLRLDAERYRWLREGDNLTNILRTLMREDDARRLLFYGDRIDQAIDAAMEGE